MKQASEKYVVEKLVAGRFVRVTRETLIQDEALMWFSGMLHRTPGGTFRITRITLVVIEERTSDA